MTRTLMALLTILLVAGCATFERMQPVPDPARPTLVVVADAQPSSMHDLKAGTYRVPDTAVYVSGHQRGEQAAMLFGALGVAIMHGLNQGGGRDRVAGMESTRQFDFVRRVREAVAQAVRQDSSRALVLSPATPVGRQLTITPFVVLTFHDAEQARPYAVLKAELADAGRVVWYTRYIAAAREQRPLDGPGSWSADGGRLLRDAIDDAVAAAVDALVRDLSGRLRGAPREVTLEGNVAFVLESIRLTGLLLSADERRVVFLPRLGDAAVVSGVNLFVTGTVKVTDAKGSVIGGPAAAPAATATISEDAGGLARGRGGH